MRTKARGTAALKPSPVRSAESHGHSCVSLSCPFFSCLALCLRSLTSPSPRLHLIVYLIVLLYISGRSLSLAFLRGHSIFPSSDSFFLCLSLSPVSLLPLSCILTVSLCLFSCVMRLFLAHYYEASPVYSVNWYNPNINSVHLSCYKKSVWSGKMNYIHLNRNLTGVTSTYSLYTVIYNRLIVFICSYGPWEIWLVFLK